MPTHRPINEADDLRDAAREAHAAMKDMRDLMREATALMTELEKAVERNKRLAHDAVDEQITEEVKAGLDEYQRMMKDHIEQSEKLVIAKFDLLYDVLMGKTPAQVRKYGVDLEEVVGYRAGVDPAAVKAMIAEQLNANPVEGVIP